MLVLLLFPFANHLMWSRSNGTSALQERDKLSRSLTRAEILYAQGQKAFLKGETKQTQKKLTRCLDIFPAHSSAHFLLAQMYYKQKKYQQALNAVSQAEESLDTYWELLDLSKKSKLLKLQERKQQLEERTKNVINNCNGEKLRMHLKRLMSELDMEMDEERGKQKTGVPGVQKNLLLADYCFFHGNVFLKQRQMENAVLQYKRAVSHNPAHVKAYNNLVNLYYVSQQYTLAFDYLNQAEQSSVSIKPDLKRAVLKSVGQRPLVSSAETAVLTAGNLSIAPFTVTIKSGPDSSAFYENAYVVFSPQKRTALLIDPGARDTQLEAFIKKQGLKVVKILNTHAHHDHIGANRYYADLFQASIMGHEGDKLLYKDLRAGENQPDDYYPADAEKGFDCGGFTVKAFHTPGHSRGSVCLLVGDFLLSGDTLFKNGVGKTWGATMRQRIQKTNQLIAGVRGKLFPLPDNTRVFPGHGYATTIGAEKTGNDFLVKTSALEILKQTFKATETITEISVLDGTPNTCDARIVFKNRQGLEAFRRSYGDCIYGLHLKLLADETNETGGKSQDKYTNKYKK